MPRPSLKEERRDQILDAYEACVARFGVEGATLERIAEEAGLARALIRHNVGNRDDLLAALVDRFEAASNREMQDLYAMLPAKHRLRTLAEWLFDPQYVDPKQVLVSEALIGAAPHYPEIAKVMRKWLNKFVSDLGDVIADEFPKADRDHVTAVAAGFTGIYFNVDSMVPLGKMSGLADASKRAVGLLIDSLEHDASNQT